MIMYKITNVTAMSVTVEDLGLNLQPGESTLITTNAYEKSFDLTKHKEWFKVEPVAIPKKGPPVPVRLFSPASPVHVPEKPIQASVPQSATSSVSHQDLERLADNLKKEIADNLKKEIGKNDQQIRLDLGTLIDMVKSMMASPKGSQAIQSESSKSSAGSSDDEISPAILPGNIVPDKITAKVRTQEDEVSASDFNETRKALRKRHTKKSAKKSTKGDSR